MFKIFYIEDQNGQYVSDDGTKKWKRLTGKELYEFLQTERGKNTCFYIDVNEKHSVAVGIEISNADAQASQETIKRRRRYVSETEKNVGYITVSFDYFATRDGFRVGDEEMPNDDESVEDSVFHQLDLETLRDALKSLTKDEYALIHALYLQEKPITTREYAKKLGVPQTTVMRSKKKILRKLKKFF